MRATVRGLAALSLTLLSLAVHADIDTARAKGFAYLIGNQRGDGSWKSGAGGLEVQATSAAVEALQASGLRNSPQFSTSVSWLNNAETASVDATARRINALVLAGLPVTEAATRLKDERNTAVVLNGNVTTGVATWGSYAGHGITFADTALGFSALRTSNLSYAQAINDIVVTTYCVLLPQQKADGSWPHTISASSQPTQQATGALLPSVLMLAELNANISRVSGYTACGRGIAQLNTAITNGRVWLQAQQNADGGFAERDLSTNALGSSNVLATALAYKTLKTLGTAVPASVLTNAENWLAGQQNINGSWRSDAFLTAQVLAALPAAVGAQRTDTDKDGIPDVVETQLGSNPVVADAGGALPGAGLAQPGLTASSFLAAGTLGQVFNYALGSGIYYQLNTGSLPPGLLLNTTTGQISGTPTQAGSYSFDYTLTPVSGPQSIVIGRIDIVEPATAVGEGDVPTLPEWGMLLLGAALMGAVAKRSRRFR